MIALCGGPMRMAKALVLRRRHAGSAVLFGVLVCATLCLHGCATVPATRYYTLDQVGSAATARVEAAGPVLKVERLAVAEPYTDRRLIYRTSKREVGFWDFCMWARPLDRMVTARVAEKLSESGMFRKVDSYPYAWDKADFVIKGAVLAFEEVDRDDGWYARVKIVLELIDPLSSDVLWSDMINVERKARERKSSSVVEALSQALDSAVDQAAAGMKGAVEEGFKEGRGGAGEAQGGDGE